ncbi:MAG: hypothetical protein NVS4B3_27500 [Gemmatimonadaceae bacterium]
MNPQRHLLCLTLAMLTVVSSCASPISAHTSEVIDVLAAVVRHIVSSERAGNLAFARGPIVLDSASFAHALEEPSLRGPRARALLDRIKKPARFQADGPSRYTLKKNEVLIEIDSLAPTWRYAGKGLDTAWGYDARAFTVVLIETTLDERGTRRAIDTCPVDATYTVTRRSGAWSVDEALVHGLC